MNETTLSALVVLQLLIIGGFELFDYLRDQPAPPFYAIDVREVEVVRLMEQDKEVVLRRISDGGGAATGEGEPIAAGDWVLEGGLPADGNKVNKMLNDLVAAGKADWPVASSVLSGKRFEVADTNYKKRLVFEKKGGDSVLDLYLGSAPSPNQTHARVAGGLGVFAIRFAEHDVSGDDKDWLSKSLLQAKGGLSLVQRLGRGDDGWTIRRSAEGWGSTEIEELNVEEAVNLSGRLKNLRILGTADVSVGYDDDKLLYNYKLSDAEGSYELKFFNQGEESLAVKSSRLPQYFEVADYLRDVLDVDKTKLTAEQQ